tara:strand:+ start:151 stop:306 length:156 start_codon:yes stop_codon:yes gene_type:complete
MAQSSWVFKNRVVPKKAWRDQWLRLIREVELWLLPPMEHAAVILDRGAGEL